MAQEFFYYYLPLLAERCVIEFLFKKQKKIPTKIK